ncbi:hypothetical protein NIES2130_11670 [Scytonema sp. HK-05]|nr:hypothetical protein NIES2130_11670 [Scytonema sp. HK-05]
MDSESTNVKSKKIRIFPNQQQTVTLKKWMGTARYVFNQTIAYLNKPDTKASWKAIKTGIIQSLPEWSKETPYQIKSIAIKDACDAVKNAKKKFQQTKQIQLVKFRSKKERRDSIYIPKGSVKSESVYITSLGKSLQPAEVFPDIEFDCKLVHQNGKFYIIIPMVFESKKSENQRLGLVALDPGVRTFQTFFSLHLNGDFGNLDIGRIYRLCAYLDNLYSRISKAKGTPKYRMLKASRRMRERIRNIVDEAHKQVAHYLCSQFDVILLPSFETSEMVVKKSRKLRSKTARAMLNWSHYRFKEYLKFKAQEWKTQVIEVSEAYTSKTCTKCGHIHTKLGGNKKFKCPSCGHTLPRDLNGSLGIYLKALVERPELLQWREHLLAMGNQS